jgi:hypothetical protein
MKKTRTMSEPEGRRDVFNDRKDRHLSTHQAWLIWLTDQENTRALDSVK